VVFVPREHQPKREAAFRRARHVPYLEQRAARCIVKDAEYHSLLLQILEGGDKLSLWNNKWIREMYRATMYQMTM
jgi:hypothetical protein